MKHVTATVLALCLLATGTAVAAPHDRGPQHGWDQPQRVAQPMRHDAGKQSLKARPAPRYVVAPPVVQRGPHYSVPNRIQPGHRHAPPRYVAQMPRRGDRLPPNMRGYRVGNWQHAGLRQPPRGYEWRRVDNRSLLVAIASGVIADIIINGR